MIYDPLVRIGEDGTPQPGLAVSWTQESPTVWVFGLRANVVFSDGEPLTATAVTEALAYLGTPAGQRDSIASQDIGRTVARVRARDPLTVEIVTRTPDPILPLHLGFLRLPAPEAWRRSGRDGFAVQPVGTGPFKVSRWSSGRVSLAAHAAAWRKPRLDGIEVSIVADPVARVQAFASGAVDVAMGVPAEDRAAIAAVGGRLAPRAAPNVHFLAFVTTRPSPLQDRRVRQALNYAVDKQALIAAFVGNAAAPASQFSHAGAFGFDPDLAPYPYDPDRARALLADAGHAAGFAFEALLDVTTGGVADWYQRIAQDLAAVGVRLTVRATPTVRIAEHVMKGDWPADSFGWTFAGFDSLRGYRFRSCALQVPYTCDPALTPLIAAAEAAPTEAGRRQATQAVLRAERDNPPGILLWRAVNFDALARTVVDYGASNDFIAWDRVALAAP
jgi:peptide/nickel transport system substrate-binding protein